MTQSTAQEKQATRGGAFDAIVIGSGIGGLTFASLMAQLRRWRVLVLERHFKIGGFTHTFSRPAPRGTLAATDAPDAWTWDVGLHYVGEMDEGAQSRKIFDLVTGGQVDWSPMPDVYDVFVYPELTIKVPKGRANFERVLTEAFPTEQKAIRAYFSDIKRAVSWFSRRVMTMVSPQPLSWIVGAINGVSEEFALQTTGQYLEKHFADARLRAVLASQWADYGLPPERSAFVAHAIIVNHYLEGAWYPVGGAGEIPKAASAIIRAAGGEVLAGHEVTKILLENGRAAGVEVQSTKGKEQALLEFRAPVVVSDAGAWNTYTRLLPASAVPFRAELGNPPEGLESVELFVGLKRDPRELGIRGENYWIFSSSDHREMCAGRDELLNRRPQMAYLSFPSLKDPQARTHTAEIITPFSYRTLQAFRHEPWRRRGTDYESAKNKMTEALVDLVEQHLPGFRDLIAYSELATPLTFEYFTAAPSGTIYGYPATPDRFRKPWLGPKTPIENLYLTGADAAVLGIVGATMGGVVTASLVLGSTGFFEILGAANAPKQKAKAAASS